MFPNSSGSRSSMNRDDRQLVVLGKEVEGLCQQDRPAGVVARLLSTVGQIS